MKGIANDTATGGNVDTLYCKKKRDR